MIKKIVAGINVLKIKKNLILHFNYMVNKNIYHKNTMIQNVLLIMLFRHYDDAKFIFL